MDGSILLLKQESHSIGAAVKECIHCTLEYSLRILCDDLKMSTEKGNVCTSLNALQHIFDSTSTYYSSYGMDMVRLGMVSGFLRIKGFKHLIAYL